MRHVSFIVFSPNEQRGGGALLFSLVYFPVHRVKYSLFGLATKTLHVKHFFEQQLFWCPCTVINLIVIMPWRGCIFLVFLGYVLIVVLRYPCMVLLNAMRRLYV